MLNDPDLLAYFRRVLLETLMLRITLVQHSIQMIFFVDNTVSFCKFSCVRTSYKKKSTLDNHLKTKKHKNQKMKKPKFQSTIITTLTDLDKCKMFQKVFLGMCFGANIALEKVSKITNFQ